MRLVDLAGLCVILPTRFWFENRPVRRKKEKREKNQITHNIIGLSSASVVLVILVAQIDRW